MKVLNKSFISSYYPEEGMKQIAEGKQYLENRGKVCKHDGEAMSSLTLAKSTGSRRGNLCIQVGSGVRWNGKITRKHL